METVSMQNNEDKKIELNADSINHLVAARKWALFLSIAGMVVTGIAFIVAMILFITSKVKTSVVLQFIPLLLLLLIYIFPIYYIFQFSKYTKKAIADLDKDLLSVSFKYLKYFFRYLGIFILVLLGIYLLAGIVGIFSFLTRSH